MASLVAGLGNPGPEHARTRHNIGQMALDRLPFADELSWGAKFKGALAARGAGDARTWFLKPGTYMNLSGESVGPACAYHKIPPEDVLVVHDELDLRFGVMAFKGGGGLAGHNGLRSVAQALGSTDFKRLRLGVGRPLDGRDPRAHVLGRFDEGERAALDDLLTEAGRAVALFSEKGFERAASAYSRRDVLAGAEGEC